MAEQGLSQQVTTLREMLVAIERQLARSDTPPEGLEDFKSTVDNVRTSVWAILSAARSRDYPNFSERFRIRRAIETCRAVIAELDAAERPMPHSELAELQVAAHELAARIAMRPSAG